MHILLSEFYFPLTFISMLIQALTILSMKMILLDLYGYIFFFCIYDGVTCDKLGWIMKVVPNFERKMPYTVAEAALGGCSAVSYEYYMICFDLNINPKLILVLLPVLLLWNYYVFVMLAKLFTGWPKPMLQLLAASLQA